MRNEQTTRVYSIQPPTRIGSLFSGIGGLELGLERATGARTVFQVEAEPFCRGILEKHWPDAQRFNDVRTVSTAALPRVDLLCGGFPCQDLSYAGKGAGIAGGERSGLWWEYARIVRDLRPQWVVVENVRALLTRGFGIVLGTLAGLGYDAEWSVLRASDVGAPHRRERLFCIAWLANPEGKRRQRNRPERDGSKEPGAVRGGQDVANAGRVGGEPHGAPGDVAGAARGVEGEGDERQRDGHTAGDGGAARVADAGDGRGQHEQRRLRGTERRRLADGGAADDHGEGLAESGVGRDADGVPARVDRWPAGPSEAQHEWEPPRVALEVNNRAARLKALGNAVVPQCAELVGRRLLEIANRRNAA